MFKLSIVGINPLKVFAFPISDPPLKGGGIVNLRQMHCEVDFKKLI